jgi:ABC-type iron transport system FetAB ATPase subunit
LLIRSLVGLLGVPYSLDLLDGTCTVLSGPSGAGKSLFLRMIADLDPNDGEVTLDSRSRAATPAPDWRRLVTYVPAEPGWWADIVAQHFLDPATWRSRLPELGLAPEMMDVPIAQLSTGERQRMALLRAVERKPRVLLLDEPTSGLDPDNKQAVEQFFARILAEGTAILMVSHDEAQAARLAATRCRMVKGHLELSGACTTPSS